MTSPDTADSVMCDPCNAAGQNTLFDRARRDGESVLQWLSRLTDEYNAPVAQK